MAAPPPRQSAGPAPTRGDAHMRHPSWGPISFKSQNLVHESEFWTLAVELRAMSPKVTLELVAVSSTSEGRYSGLWTRVWQFPRTPPEPREKASTLAPRHPSGA